MGLITQRSVNTKSAFIGLTTRWARPMHRGRRRGLARLNDPEAQAEMLLAIAYQRERQGNLNQAAQAIREGINGTKWSKDSALLGDLHSRLASMQEKQGNTASAERHYREALKVYRSIGAKQQASSTLVRLSAIDQSTGNKAAAQRQLKEAQEAAPANINKMRKAAPAYATPP